MNGKIMIDLFENVDVLPEPIRNICIQYSEIIANSNMTYQLCEEFETLLKPHGYTFDWGLDAEPHNLRKIKGL
jgi:hypothetical protein